MKNYFKETRILLLTKDELYRVASTAVQLVIICLFRFSKGIEGRQGCYVNVNVRWKQRAVFLLFVIFHTSSGMRLRDCFICVIGSEPASKHRRDRHNMSQMKRLVEDNQNTSPAIFTTFFNFSISNIFSPHSTYQKVDFKWCMKSAARCK